MNTAEIACVLNRAFALRQPRRNYASLQFLGVFAADTVPSAAHKFVFPCCFVINTDKSSQPGEHWVACLVLSPRHVEFFYSYGMSASAYPNLNIPFRITVRNTVLLQSLGSVACGHYCIYFLCMRLNGRSLGEVVRHLSHLGNYKQRDRFLYRFLHNLTARLHILRPCVNVNVCLGLQCCVPRKLRMQ